MKITKAIITAAGLGTRFLPATKSQPKEMLPIVDKPVLHFLVEEIVNSGIKDIIFITGKGKRAIEDYFGYSFELENVFNLTGKKDLLKAIRQIAHLANFTYVRQKEPLGDGDALLCANHLIADEPVAVLFGDNVISSKISCTAQLVEVFDKYNCPIVGIEKINKIDSKKYGIIDSIKLEKNIFAIKRIIEKPDAKNAPSALAMAGRYILTPSVFKELEVLRQKNQDKNKELKLVDALDNLAQKEKIYGLQFSGQRYDCGSKIGLLKAIIDFGLKHPEVKKEFKKYLKSVNLYT